MGKNTFEELDPDLRAMRASMRPSAGPMRWSRVLTGILLVGCATFAFAYYLPLERAHQTLTARFTELSSQVDSSKRALEESRKAAKELGEKQELLERQLSDVTQLNKQRASASLELTSALKSKLDKPLAKNQAALGVAAGQTMAALSLDYVVTRGKLVVSPQGQTALCSVASTAGKRALRVLAVVDQKSIPAALARTHKAPLQYSVAVATLVADTMLDKCRTDPTRLSAAGVPAEPASAPKLEGKKLDGPRIELWIEGAL
jgi:hypothetical protein